jgi:hypothetical protein
LSQRRVGPGRLEPRWAKVTTAVNGRVNGGGRGLRMKEDKRTRWRRWGGMSLGPGAGLSRAGAARPHGLRKKQVRPIDGSGCEIAFPVEC